jgi:hypothetical protein
LKGQQDVIDVHALEGHVADDAEDAGDATQVHADLAFHPPVETCMQAAVGDG